MSMVLLVLLVLVLSLLLSIPVAQVVERSEMMLREMEGPVCNPWSGHTKDLKNGSNGFPP